MMKNLLEKTKDLFSKYKQLDPESKVNYFYIAVFAAIIVMALILKLTGNLNVTKLKDRNEEQSSKTTIEEPIEDTDLDYEDVISSLGDNYEEDITISLDNDQSVLNIKQVGLGQLINYTNKKQNNMYVEYIGNYYKINNDSAEKLDGEPFEGIDITFINPTNIIKLINNKTYQKDNSYMIETSAWLELYNNINNKKREKLVTGEIEINMLSYKEGTLELSLDLTNLYKNLDYDYKKVTYNIKFYNIGTTTLPEDLELPDFEEIKLPNIKLPWLKTE